MATVPITPKKVIYPTSDGRPMAETDQHRDQMMDLIETLKTRYRDQERVYVSGNLLMFYVEGDKHKHVSPDVFVVLGIPMYQRENYLVWEEGKGPDWAMEVTSKSTKDEDIKTKFALYRDVLRVSEYFMFDPRGDYLNPPLQGYRLLEGEYVPIQPVNGRLPSEVLGLYLEQVGSEVRLYDPATGQYLPTPREAVDQAEAARQQAEAARQQEAAARQQAETARQQEAAARQQADAARQQAEAELARLRQELETLRQRPPKET